MIVSVNPNIREYETASNDQRGRHLVLVTGYDKQQGTMTLHHSSEFKSQDTQEYQAIPVKKVSQILYWKKHCVIEFVIFCKNYQFLILNIYEK